MRRLLSGACLMAAMLWLLTSTLVAAESPRPNVVLIMTDNQGAWTLGCYGNPDIRTPNIDRMAREGLLFSRCFSSNAVCSPSRATVLTGLIPSQHGVHNWLSGGNAQIGPKAYCTIQEFRALSDVLVEQGYVCGLSGKWHLGDNLHPQKGFTFWVTKPAGDTGSLYSTPVIENGMVHTEPGYATDYWTRRGIEFIQQNKEKPFFLFLAYNGPYGHSPPGAGPAHNRHVAYYAQNPLKSFPREKVHPWLVQDRKLVGNLDALRTYAAEVSGIDDGVGEILRTLEKTGLDRNTLVIFTADQGFACGQSGCWGMGAHTRPYTAFDWTMHVPMIYRHPAGIPPGRKSDLMVSHYDFLPTMLAYLKFPFKTPGRPESPGRDYSAALRGESVADWDNVVFYEYLNVRAIRTAEWKYVQRFRQEPNELYDLKSDPEERTNLIDQAGRAEVQKELRQRLGTFFDRYADPKYDLWHGGKGKFGIYE